MFLEDNSLSNLDVSCLVGEEKRLLGAEEDLRLYQGPGQRGEKKQERFWSLLRFSEGSDGAAKRSQTVACAFWLGNHDSANCAR